MKEKFYITTAIDYPNGNPHMGHAFEKIVTDCYARWNRLMGKDVFFLTGTDENGQKLVESAKENGKETLSYVDEQVEGFRKLVQDLNISNDDFIRTTEKRHVETTHSFWNKLKEKEDIYFGKYSGYYCLSCEDFYTETQAPDQICPSHLKPLELKEEEGYFFKMSRYQDWIIKHFEENADCVVPASRHKEILSRLKGDELKDLAISRPNEGWGIEVPEDKKFVVYTWFDALINYYSAVKDKNLWPASTHVIGKDISWFHSVIWPCMLNSAGLELPRRVYVHGMVLGSDGKKMSKSLGNGVAPHEVLGQFPLDSFRYYILKAISSTADGPFSVDSLKERHNNELANAYGNLVMRILKFTLKKLGPKVTIKSKTRQDIRFDEIDLQVKNFMEKYEHHRALAKIWEGIQNLNQYINDRAPWSVKDNPKELETIMGNCLFGLSRMTKLLIPFIPHTATKVINNLGVDSLLKSDLDFESSVYEISEPEILFPKIED